MPTESDEAFVLKFLVFDAMIISYQITGYVLDAWDLVSDCERQSALNHHSDTRCVLTQLFLELVPEPLF
jgi:hypothetical protein